MRSVLSKEAVVGSNRRMLSTSRSSMSIRKECPNHWKTVDHEPRTAIRVRDELRDGAYRPCN